MKIALITGANRSIGLETTKQLSNKNIFVYLGSRDLEEGKKVARELRENGYENIKAVEIDITKPETILSAKKIIEKEQGKLDILINNAGIMGGFEQKATNTTIESIKETFDVNFYGAIRVSQTFLELLKKSDQPRITNITSGLASLTLHNDPTWKYYDFKAISYVSSKAALNAFTIALSYELKDLPFKVNAIDPGFTSTDFNNHQGTGSVESAASFILKHTLTDENAPTGKFFSNDIDSESEQSPW